MAFPPATAGGDMLSSPPPSPQMMGGGPTGDSPFALAGPAPIPTADVPPEVKTGILSAAQKIKSMLGAFSQALPDKAAQFNVIMSLLDVALGDIQATGGGPISPTATGLSFPGGGMDSGRFGAGSL